ncbi:MAG: hypothetical protein MUC59_07540 [Saprospiraceae bacterium]|nr:hypothetical protein [Saprospiraceae bacterium]
MRQMQFLKKNPQSALTQLRYSEVKERDALRKGLLREQYGFCAYSERFVKQSDSCNIEHFYPKGENPEKEDDYMNLYAAHSWMDAHKPKKIAPYLPILEPHATDLHDRICYEGGIFKCVNEGDKEAENLVEFLGFNKYEVSEDRRKHIGRVKQLRSWNTETEFLEYLKKHRQELSFATALEKELGIPAMQMILESY